MQTLSKAFLSVQDVLPLATLSASALVSSHVIAENEFTLVKVTQSLHVSLYCYVVFSIITAENS